jgi:hypothetical protein
VVVALASIINERTARAKDKRVEQARRISGWLTSYGLDEPTAGQLANNSDEPVYRLVVWLVRWQGGGGPATGEEQVRLEATNLTPVTIANLPPGRYTIHLPPFVGGMMARPGIEIGFTDAAGRHWIRRVDGRLESITKEPADHYGIGLPQGWDLLTK